MEEPYTRKQSVTFPDRENIVGPTEINGAFSPAIAIDKCSELNAAYAAGQAARWIPVGERLPELPNDPGWSDYVLAATKAALEHMVEVAKANDWPMIHNQATVALTALSELKAQPDGLMNEEHWQRVRAAQGSAPSPSVEQRVEEIMGVVDEEVSHEPDRWRVRARLTNLLSKP